MKNLIFILITIFYFQINAEALKSITLPDQFDQQTAIDENTQWIIYTSDKDMAENINKAIDDLKITDIKSLGGVYVNEISRMPSMITKMFALPQMQKYSFKVLLDKEGDLTSKWPQEKGKASLINLNKLQIKNVEKTVSFEAVKKFLELKMKSKSETTVDSKKEGK